MISPFASFKNTNPDFNVDFIKPPKILTFEQIKIIRYMNRNVYNIPIRKKRSFELDRKLSKIKYSYFCGILTSSTKKKCVKFSDKPQIFEFQKSISLKVA